MTPEPTSGHSLQQAARTAYLSATWITERLRAAETAIRTAEAERRAAAIADTLSATRDYLTRFVAFPSQQAADAASLFTAYTHIASRFNVAPRLLIEAEEHGCGKSTLRRAIQHASARPLMMSRATGAAMYQALGAYNPAQPRGSCPTLFLDEMDTLTSAILGEVSGVVNAGFEAGEPIRRNRVAWNTFGPAVIVGIEVPLAESTRSRAVRIMMRRDGFGQLDRGKRIPEQAELIRTRLTRMAASLPADLAGWDAAPGPLTYRLLDKWEPMLLLAEHAGDEWTSRAYKAATTLETI